MDCLWESMSCTFSRDASAGKELFWALPEHFCLVLRQRAKEVEVEELPSAVNDESIWVGCCECKNSLAMGVGGRESGAVARRWTADGGVLATSLNDFLSDFRGSGLSLSAQSVLSSSLEPVLARLIGKSETLSLNGRKSASEYLTKVSLLSTPWLWSGGDRLLTGKSPSFGADDEQALDSSLSHRWIEDSSDWDREECGESLCGSWELHELVKEDFLEEWGGHISSSSRAFMRTSGGRLW